MGASAWAQRHRTRLGECGGGWGGLGPSRAALFTQDHLPASDATSRLWLREGGSWSSSRSSPGWASWGCPLWATPLAPSPLGLAPVSCPCHIVSFHHSWWKHPSHSGPYHLLSFTPFPIMAPSFCLYPCSCPIPSPIAGCVTPCGPTPPTGPIKSLDLSLLR